LRILVVDDEAGSRTALDAVLRVAGHHPMFARDGDEALEMCNPAATAFDMVLTDHAMARVSGPDFVRRVRAKGYAGEIVVLTAYAGALEAEEYRELDVACVMEKPFDAGELRHWIECIHGCREQSPAGAKIPGRLRAIDFCRPRRD